MSQLLRFNQDVEELWSSLGEIDLVSFEMRGGLFRHDFDTDPQFFAALGERLGVVEFAEDREMAQKLVLRRAPDTPWNFPLQEIYAGLRATADDELTLLEETLEPIPHARRFLESAVARGIRVIAACDGPFPKDFWQARLDRFGISGVERIVTSCEDGVSKQRYTTFRHLLSHYKVDAARAFHFGSDSYNDLGVPLDIGMKAMLVEPAIEGIAAVSPLLGAVRDAVSLVDPANGGLVLRAIERAWITGPEADAEDRMIGEIGAAVLGPCLVSFCQWLREWLMFHGCKKCLIVGPEMTVFSRVSRILLQRMVPGLEIAVVSIERIPELALSLRDIDTSDFAIVSVDAEGAGAGHLIARNPLLSIRPIFHFMLDHSPRNMGREPVFFHGNGFPEDRAKIARLAEPVFRMLFNDQSGAAIQSLPKVGQFVIEWSKLERRYRNSRISRRQIAALLEAVTRLELPGVDKLTP